MNKVCNKCCIEKSCIDFPKQRKACKVCCKKECRDYKKLNKNKISEYNYEYKKKNKISISLYNKEYNLTNRDIIQKRHTAYLKNRRITNPNYKMSTVLRNRLKKLVKGEKHTMEVLGCDILLFRKWFEFQFSEKMNFDNHGTIWHVDHVIPCAKFNLLNDVEVNRCFNWTNLQPLECKKNLSKKDSLTQLELDSHTTKLTTFINNNELSKDTVIPKYNKDAYV